VQRLDRPLPPSVTAQDDFFEFLFSNAEVKYAELKEKAAKQEPLPSFTLKGVKLTFNLDADYQVVRTQFTRNVIGVIEGSDPQLKDTYVAFSAHYDHVGYAEGEVVQGARQGAVGRVKEGAVEDRIWNGADDDSPVMRALLVINRLSARTAGSHRESVGKNVDFG
jgi:Peptidase family M28